MFRPSGSLVARVKFKYDSRSSKLTSVIQTLFINSFNSAKHKTRCIDAVFLSCIVQIPLVLFFIVAIEIIDLLGVGITDISWSILKHTGTSLWQPEHLIAWTLGIILFILISIYTCACSFFCYNPLLITWSIFLLLLYFAWSTFPDICVL